MSYYILGISREEYKKRIRKQMMACIVFVLAAAVLNVMLCILRTDATHMAFLIINIVVDSIIFGVIFFIISTRILPKRKLYQLASHERNALKMCGSICGISDITETVCGLECLELTVEELVREEQVEEKQVKEKQVKKESAQENMVRRNVVRKIFVAKENEVPFELQGEAVFYVVNNIIIRAEVQL